MLENVPDVNWCIYIIKIEIHPGKFHDQYYFTKSTDWHIKETFVQETKPQKTKHISKEHIHLFSVWICMKLTCYAFY